MINLKDAINQLSNRDKEERTSKTLIDPKKYRNIFVNKMFEIFYRTHNENEEFRFCPELEKAIELLCAYGNKEIEFEKYNELYSLDKGILLAGNYGSGKTLLITTFKEVYELVTSKPMGFLSCEDLNQKFRKKNEHDKNNSAEGFNGLSIYVNKYDKTPRIFDDIGEEKTIVDFGNKVDTIEYVFKEREKGIINGVVTHGTTNLTQEEVLKRYGGRINSRFSSMFNIIKLGSKANSVDFRKTKSIWKEK